VATRKDKAGCKKPVEDTWVRNVGERNTGFNLQKEKETFIEEKNSFMDLGASTSRTQMQLVP